MTYREQVAMLKELLEEALAMVERQQADRERIAEIRRIVDEETE